MPKIYSKALTENEVNELVSKYPLDKIIEPDREPWSSQYDTRSASINYAMVRDFKPKVVLEFGSRAGRCTRDIFRALVDNGGDFVFKPYELSDKLRLVANANLMREFGDSAPTVGGNVMEATDIPKDIDYLFVDNFHDEETTKWVFDELLPKYGKPGCLVHFHDLYIQGDWQITSSHGESIVIGNHKDVLSKVYWTWEEGTQRSSAWFQFKP
jgi:hypothetical protein